MMMLAAALGAQAPCVTHVRSDEPRIVRLIDVGRSQSETFRRLLDRLDESDVIVYIHPKQKHEALGGYLSHKVVVAGGCRYLHVALTMLGADRWLVALLAHELQHVVEVADHPEARDRQSVAAMFELISIKSACAESDCAETKAAQDVQNAVNDELGAIRAKLANAH